jgi:tetratricopeptide (TPR) repeat protein
MGPGNLRRQLLERPSAHRFGEKPCPILPESIGFSEFWLFHTWLLAIAFLGGHGGFPMRRIRFLGLFLALLAGTFGSGCSKGARPQSDQTSETSTGSTPERPAPRSVPPSAIGSGPVIPNRSSPAGSVATPADPNRQVAYDAALLDAVSLLNERKYTQALAALETARTLQDTEQVQREIAKLKGVLEQQAAAERTIADIQIILADGKAEEAARLATAALQQYGSTDAAEPLTKLKRQADALVSAPLADNVARRDRFRQEGQAALRDNNLRAAAIALEQALQYGDNADLRRQLEETRANLTRYDDNRRRAAELRRDPSHFEEALAALQEAAKAWDTLQVHQEIDDCNLALQKRRDRLGVADFEVRGEVGIPLAGRTVAEELLPAFRSRFDIVERSQLDKVAVELKLQTTDLAENSASQREVGRLAQLRFLVLGSVTPLSGITVSARLVDVRSGLVVQTAKVVAPTAEELLPLLPQLANVLQMTDEEKIAYEQRQAQQAAVQPVVVASLPPPPELPIADQPPPPPLVVNSPRPPELGAIRPEDFDRLPPPPPDGQPLLLPGVVGEREEAVKQKVVQVAVELGDNLFRRGRFREAHLQFELALTLNPSREDLRLRSDRCRPHLPPPVVVVATPLPPRPRIAILNFVVSGDPALFPPGLGAWAAEEIAPYFCPPYEVIDRGEVFWYMQRLGMTLRELLTDPAARRYLGRALNLRSFVFGTVRPGRGLEVTTHLVDAEYGFETGGGRIQVLDPQELKLRLGELARLTRLDPLERARYLRAMESSQTLLVEARQRSAKGEFSVALDSYQRALKLCPDSVEIQVLFQRTDKRAREAALEEARRREFERQQALATELQRRQWELAREAEAARIRAEQEAAAGTEALRRAQEQQRERAHQQLLLQGQLALQQNNFQLSFQLFESAAGLKRNDATFRELALARAKAEEAARVRAAEDQARREAELRRQREAELVQARAQLEEERRRHEAEERARRETQEARDQAEYTRLLDQGQRLLAQEKYAAALDALQAACRLRKTEAADRLVSQALVEQARATAKGQDARARADLERQLAEERTRRQRAEDEARRKGELYTQALQAAQQALATKRYEQAVVKYQEAGTIFRTDVVLNGLREAEEARTREGARAEAEKRKQAEEQKRLTELQRLLSQGQAALQAQQWDTAVTILTAAKKLAPTNVDVLAGLSKAEHAREESLLETRRKQEDQQRQATLRAEAEARKQDEAKRRVEFQRLMTQGQGAAAGKRYDEAVKAYSAALQHQPGDAAATKALTEATQALVASKAPSPPPQPTPVPSVKTPPPASPGSQPKQELAAKPPVQTPPAPVPAPPPMPPQPTPGQQPAPPAAKTGTPAKSVPPAKAEPQPKSPQIAPTVPPTTTPMPPQTQPGQPPAPLPVDPRAEYAKQMQAAAAFEKQQKYAEAIRAYKQALVFLPKDPRATLALRNAEFTQHMVEGRKALAAKRFADAAREFEEALKLVPNNPEATKALKQAQEGRP